MFAPTAIGILGRHQPVRRAPHSFAVVPKLADPARQSEENHASIEGNRDNRLRTDHATLKPAVRELKRNQPI